MKFYKLQYSDDINDFEYKQAENTKELFKKYDLATVKHLKTTIMELNGEQGAIANDFLNN